MLELLVQHLDLHVEVHEVGLEQPLLLLDEDVLDRDQDVAEALLEVLGPILGEDVGARVAAGDLLGPFEIGGEEAPRPMQRLRTLGDLSQDAACL